jgi:hypothetical protein
MNGALQAHDDEDDDDPMRGVGGRSAAIARNRTVNQVRWLLWSMPQDVRDVQAWSLQAHIGDDGVAHKVASSSIRTDPVSPPSLVSHSCMDCLCIITCITAFLAYTGGC